MHVVLRTDASGRIGTGHFRRCQSLAASLRAAGATTLFVSRNHDGVSTACAAGESVAWLPAPAPGFQPAAGDPPHAAWAGTDWQADAEQTSKTLQEARPDWLVVDHYAFDARWHRQVRRATGARLLVIDDLGDRELEADLLLDHNLQPATDKYAGRLPDGTRRLAGPRYALLAPAYAHAPRYRFRRQARSIGMFFSGGDAAAGLAATALGACRAGGFQGPIEVVASAGAAQSPMLLQALEHNPPARLRTDLPDLAGFFASHDLQLGSGGGAAWERCCVGAPTLAVLLAENQRAVLPELERLGALRWVDPPDEPALAHAVRDLCGDPRARLAMSRAGRQLVDGRGAARVAAVMHLLHRPELGLRPLEPTDQALLLAWANDPEVRRQSFRPARVAPGEHATWFAARLAHRDRFQVWIACAPGGVPVGQVRFTRGDDHWGLDYLLDPAFRGLGLARTMVAQALAALARTAGGTARVRALVKAGNAASVRVFRGLGFAETMEQTANGPCHVLTLTLPPPSEHEDR